MTDRKKTVEFEADVDTTRRKVLKGSVGAMAMAAGAASLAGIKAAMAASSSASSTGSSASSGAVPFSVATNEGFPAPKVGTEIWALNYAGNFFPGLRNGPALYAMFYPPTGMYIEDDGSIKVCDARNSVIRNISTLGDATVFTGSVQQYPTVDGTRVNATFNSPNDIDKLSDGSYVVGDRENNAIRLITPDGTVRTIAGQGNCKNRYNGDQAIATNGRLFRSLTLKTTRTQTAWHTVDTIYFADRDNQLIRKLVPNGDGTFALVTVAGTPPTGSDPAAPLTYYPGAVDGPVAQARFRGACGLELSDDERYLYVAERDNNVVRVIDLALGVVGTYAGVVMVGQKKGAFADGPADQARFNGPSQLVLDAEGNLYLADRFNARIRKITPSADPMKGAEVSTYAGSGENGRRSGPAGSAQFYEPWGVAFDRNSGLLYVGDTGNSRVSVIGPYNAIWPDFLQRVNAARVFEYQELMADYQNVYMGTAQRDMTLPAFVGEGPGVDIASKL